jgi:hypothetical protein
MSEPTDSSPVFNYVVSVQGREFIITIHEDSMSRWDDLSLTSLPERIHGEEGENSVIKIRISDEIYSKALTMAENEKLEEARTGQVPSPVGNLAADIAAMDRMLTDFYWLRVNLLHPKPLNQPLN